MEKYTTSELIAAERVEIPDEQLQIESKKTVITNETYALCEFLDKLNNTIHLNG